MVFHPLAHLYSIQTLSWRKILISQVTAAANKHAVQMMITKQYFLTLPPISLSSSHKV